MILFGERFIRAEGTNLRVVMQWIKTRSAKLWNGVHGSKNHVWGERFFARAVRDQQEFEFVMNYIDQNPVVAELVQNPEDWKASGAYYRYRKTPSPIPPAVALFLPPAQLKHTEQYYGVYADDIERLNAVISKIPPVGGAETLQEPPVYLHYFTKTADYFICEFDGEDTVYGKVRFNVCPAETEYRKFSLSRLKKNQFLELDFSWVPDINRK